MAARRLIFVMLVLLVLSSAVAALIPVERDAVDETSSTTTTTTDAAAPAGELVRRTIDADRTKPQTIRIRVGDQLELRVTSSKPGQVQILRPGVFEDVDPDFPARIDLLLLNRGTYPVRLLPPTPPTDRGRVIARIIVGPPPADPAT